MLWIHVTFKQAAPETFLKQPGLNQDKKQEIKTQQEQFTGKSHLLRLSLDPSGVV